ncbi:MAG: hypothetical protein HUJ72_00370 [Blautia sp.]|nr:hypothetical protein [Blautia sp.]
MRNTACNQRFAKSVRKCMVLLLATMLLTVLSVPVCAKDITTIQKNVVTTLYPNQGKAYHHFPLILNTSGKIKGYSLSDKSIGTIKNVSNSLIFYPKKVGKTTLKVVVGNKTYKSNITVKKYKNPVSSFKIGNQTVSGKKFDKNSLCKLDYSKFKNKKVSLKFKLKKDWVLCTADGKTSCMNYNSEKTTPLAEYVQAGWMSTRSMFKGDSVKVQGGKGFFFEVCVKNKNTSQIEKLRIQLN